MILGMTTIIGQFVFAQVVKKQYQDKHNQQTMVIVKDSTATDLEVLTALDMDEYTMGQEVRITPEMLAALNKKKQVLASPAVLDEERGIILAPALAKAETATIEKEKVSAEKPNTKSARKIDETKKMRTSKQSLVKTKSKRYKKRKARGLTWWQRQQLKWKSKKRRSNRNMGSVCYRF